MPGNFNSASCVFGKTPPGLADLVRETILHLLAVGRFAQSPNTLLQIVAGAKDAHELLKMSVGRILVLDGLEGAGHGIKVAINVDQQGIPLKAFAEEDLPLFE